MGTASKGKKEEQEEERRQQKKAEAQRMKDAEERARRTGGAVYETWNDKQVFEECKRRGISITVAGGTDELRSKLIKLDEENYKKRQRQNEAKVKKEQQHCAGVRVQRHGAGPPTCQRCRTG